MSELAVDNITGSSATGASPITLSGNTATLGTSVDTTGWEVDYLVLAGGGSGGHGGGGAGGYRLGSTTLSGEKSGGDTDPEKPITVFRGMTYEVPVGLGSPSWNTSMGTASGSLEPQQWRYSRTVAPTYQGMFPSPIGDSRFGPIHSIEGGSGTNEDYNHPGWHGGSGGGSGGSTTNTSEGLPGQGSKGASSTATSGGNKGGGGGAGGDADNSTKGNGGIGLESSITGTAVKRAGGGGGGRASGYGHGYGGNGDWGGGRSDPPTGSGGYYPALNKGGGGSGGYTNSGSAGGDGIVIISYLNTYPDLKIIHSTHVCNGQAAGTTTAPSPTTNRTGYKCYEFTAGRGGISW